MCTRLTVSVLIASLLGLVSTASAAVLQCDAGTGTLQSGWTQVQAGSNVNVGGTGINVTLATGNPGAIAHRGAGDTGGGSGPLAAVEEDLYFANDEQQSPGADFILTLSNLTSGTAYRLLSYHNRSNEGDTTIPGTTVTGATVISKPDSILQSHAIMDNPAEFNFIAGTGDVVIRYQAPAGGCGGCQAFFNGFVLEYSGPSISFASGSSGGVETISPALIPVNLANPEPGATYTVQYAVTGGTATSGDDYTLTPGTLIFSPGQTTKNISIDIVNDGAPEEDETIILELSSPTGPNVTLGTDQHTYTISDTRPKVFFNTATDTGPENSTPVMIAVELSLASDEIVTVDYAVTGGSATNGADYILADGTLQFNPLDTTEYISIDIIDDSLEEEVETIVLSLSNPVNATLGTTSQYTYSILDNEQGLVWDGVVWYYSENSGGPFVNVDGDLEWDPEREGQFITRIPAQDISDVDDIVEISYWLLTDGDHDCPDCFDCGLYCLDDDITCIAGTSDFRFGMFEADGEYITSDGMGHNNSMFVGYKGYNWRFGPNMLAGPTRWVDCTNEVHKTGNFAKKPVDSHSLMSLNEGLSGNDHPIPGFECPPGTWSLLTLRLERTSSSSIEMLITYNDRTYTWTDSSGDDQPSMIDVFGVHMRNGRPYDRLVLDTLWQPPPEAWDPSPPDSAGNQSVDVVLSWQAGSCLFRHVVYLGDDYDSVLNATGTSPDIFKGYFNPGEETFDPDVDGIDPQPLELWKTYYWRIDEIHSPQPPCSDYPTITKGNVWSFTTGTDMTPAGNPSPAHTAENVHPGVVLEWDPGLDATSHDVYFGTDSDAVEVATTSSDEYEGRQDLDANSYDPCGLLELATIYYWRIDEVNEGEILEGQVWHFRVDDGKARNPNPANGTWSASTN
ncbi:MAG: Calx-beta domain-containing protein, partial [Planctomycetota bacterium]